MIRSKHFFLWMLSSCLTLSVSFAAQAVEIPGSKETGYHIPYPTPNYRAAGVDPALGARGEYLVKAGDCIACHTDAEHKGEVFAGGLRFNSPFGPLYSPNLTPDKETGIGSWTDEQFIKAMHEGVGPDGNYFPAFPYTNFNKLSKDDILAIRAYLKSIPAVRQANKENDLMWPFSMRLLQYGWKLLFFYPHRGEFKPNPKQSETWNRGAYLVEGLGHCSMCHTPRNLLMGEKMDYYLTGGFIDGFYAPDITSVGLKDASVEEIMDVFRHSKMLGGRGKVAGPMADANNNSLHYLSESDMRAIATYLKTVKSKEPEKSSAAITADTGKEVYEAKCAVCHNTGAAGAPLLGDGAEWKKRVDEAGLPMVIDRAIKGFNSMPPMGACMTCSTEEITATVKYMIEDSEKGGTTKAPARVAAGPQLTMAQGQKVYEKYCATCHAQGKLGAPQTADAIAWAPYIAEGVDTLIGKAIHGYRGMPVKGACYSCTSGEVQAAVIYLLQQNGTGDYSLWLP